MLDRNHSTLIWKNCETSTSQQCISQYCRHCTFYLFHDKEMVRWYLTASKLTALNQSQADQDLNASLLILFVRYRVNFNNINFLRTSCFFILQYLKIMISITGGVDSDFLFSWASFEQVSILSEFLLLSFECVFLVRVIYIVC